jgi:integrase
VSGPTPNLFKGSIPPFSDITKPDWVIEEEAKNCKAEFWQFQFNVVETKTGIDVHSLLPKQLIPLLEEYLREHRPRLLRSGNPETLFLNRAGRTISRSSMTELVEELTLRYGGKKVNPHSFRDIVAYTWLRHHPEDYFTLSKMLWHSNLATTTEIYGSRFNESAGVAAMESWLDKRQTESPNVH